MDKRQIVLSVGAVAAVLAASPAFAQAVSSDWRILTLGVFGAIIAVTMYVTYLAAKRTKTAADFYTAGGGVSGLQNGWAIAGDYLSAASFLGIAGLISLYGYDGFMYSVGWLVAYITVLLVIASLVMVALVWGQYGFSLPGYLGAVVADADVQAQVARLLGDSARNIGA